MSATKIDRASELRALARQWCDAVATADEALFYCHDPKLIALAKHLNAVSDLFWERGDRRHLQASIQMQQLVALLLAPKWVA